MDEPHRPQMPATARALLAGAAGTVALNVATYLDMVLRARPSSEVPARLIGAFAQRWHLTALLEDGDDEQKNAAAAHRRDALGALLGYVNGLGLPVLSVLIVRDLLPSRSGTVLGLLVMAASDVPAMVAGVTDPASWTVTDWMSDLAPHLLYGWVANATYCALGRHADGM